MTPERCALGWPCDFCKHMEKCPQPKAAEPQPGTQTRAELRRAARAARRAMVVQLWSPAGNRKARRGRKTGGRL